MTRKGVYDYNRSRQMLHMDSNNPSVNQVRTVDTKALRAALEIHEILPNLTHSIKKLPSGRRIRRICQECYFESSTKVGDDNLCIDTYACANRQITEGIIE